MKKLQMIISVSIFLLFLFWMHVPLSVYADEDPTVIVIDPGHGGDNLGAEFDTYTEKNMTMTVALAMKEELEKYDNVIVYLTRGTVIRRTCAVCQRQKCRFFVLPSL